MKKSLGIILLALLMAVCCGCEKVVDLTDEENYLIAEYAAELLIKYSSELDLKYDPDATEAVTETPVTEATTEMSTEAVTEAPVTEEPSTEATTEVVTTEEAQASSTEEKTTESGGDVHVVEVDGDEEPTEDTPAGVDKTYDIAQIIGCDVVSVTYSYYMIAETYPSYDQDGMYIEIQATPGHKLLVLKFAIENKTNEQQALDFYAKDVDYHIIINGNKSAKNMLTILIDDLYTYQAKIEPSDRQEVVLLFSISESLAGELKDLKLRCTALDGNEVVMQLEN